MGGSACMLSLALATPAFAAVGEPVADGSGAIFRPAEWVKGQVGASSQGYYWGVPPNMYYSVRTYAMSGVHVPNQPITAGQIFYIHAWAGLVTPVQGTVDIAVPSLGLPEGVSVVPTSEARTFCYITKSNYIPTRDPGCPAFTAPASGGSIPLGQYALSVDDQGAEGVDIFVPVRANGPVSGQSVFISTRMQNTPSILPNPLYGDAPLTVGPGNGTGGGGAGTGGDSATLTAPSNPKYVKRGKNMIVTWDAIPGATAYRARLKVGKKWTKWATLTNNGVKLSKLKKGKRYVLQVQAVGGPTSTWRFKGK